MAEQDEVFFSELAVDRDELIVLPMQTVREWFERHRVEHAPRPILPLDGVAAWYRPVPRQDVERAVEGVRRVRPVFGALAW